MGFCGKCGREVPPEDAFCRECGAPLASPPAPGASAAPPAPAPAPPPPASPPAPAPAPPPQPARRFPVWVAVLIGVLVLGAAAGAAAVYMKMQPKPKATASAADPGSLGFDAEPFDPAATPVGSASETLSGEPAATTEPEPEASPEPTATPTPEPEAAFEAPAQPELTASAAMKVVDRMLDYMNREKESQALALVTKNMLKDVNNDKTWFSPGKDVLISWEIQDAAKKGSAMRVRVLEQWNSGPERTSYDVVISGGKLKVDGIKWSSW